MAAKVRGCFIIRSQRSIGSAHAVDRYLKLAEAFGAAIPKQLRFPLPTGDPCRASIPIRLSFSCIHLRAEHENR